MQNLLRLKLMRRWTGYERVPVERVEVTGAKLTHPHWASSHMRLRITLSWTRRDGVHIDGLANDMQRRTNAPANSRPFGNLCLESLTRGTGKHDTIDTGHLLVRIPTARGGIRPLEQES